MNDYLNVAPLGDLVIIKTSGADAVSFLQNQLTQDVAHLDTSSARLAGYCTAKGRLVASMVVWAGDTTDEPVLYILAKADIATSLVKRLSMYILRARVSLQITPLKVFGVSSGFAAPASAATSLTHDRATTSDSGPLAADLPDLPVHPRAWTVVHSDQGTCIAAPSADTSIDRWWFIPTPDVAFAQDDAGQAPWHAADIAAGLPWIVAATQDMFIPQTLNLDLIDGVSFTKGCYPGQEVVARSHYRGKIKRRMAQGLVNERLRQDVAELAGTDIFDAKRPDNPCGRVINAAQIGSTHLLLEVQLADLGVADFRLGRADGPSIALQPLPYEIEESLSAQP